MRQVEAKAEEAEFLSLLHKTPDNRGEGKQAKAE